MKAFQIVHFQIAYHSRVISPSHTKWDADSDLTSVQQKLETVNCHTISLYANAYSVAMGENPCNTDYNRSAM